jgi:(p)ppGpp synthase/HD superfamily hydrolase
MSYLVLEALDFAARHHRENGADHFVNHLIDVATLLARSGVDDAEVLAAAVLHDVVEDTDATLDEVEHRFGTRVSALVASCFDDRSLPQAERQRIQLEGLRRASREAKAITLADHCSNALSLPADWTPEKRRQYLAWSEAVVAACAGTNPQLEELHAERVAAARRELTSH